MESRSRSLLYTFTLVFSLNYPIATIAAPLDRSIDDYSSDRPVVVSPVRLKQSLADAPAAVTIITRDQIKRYGFPSVVEALRLVPGFAVSARGNEAQVYSHGGNIVPRRLNLMIDGVTYFRSAFTAVDWEALPISMEDIDRIEVTRAPSAATYGSNSFSAVVNIISLHPAKAGSQASVQYSTQDDARVFGRTTFQNGNTLIRVSGESANVRGFDQLQGERNRADTYFSKMNVRSVSEMGDYDRVEMLGTITHGKREVLSVENHQTSNPDIDVDDIALSGQWTRSLDSHQIQSRLNYFHGVREQEWNTCQIAAGFLPEAANLWSINPNYVLSLFSNQFPQGGGAEADAALQALLMRMAAYGPTVTNQICATTDQNYSETTIDAEIQDTWQISNQLRLVSSINYRNDAATSKAFIGGTRKRDQLAGSFNAEWRTQWTTLNVGDYFENDNYSGGNNAPRAVLNVHLSADHTLRFGWTQSFKTPEIRATNADWRYYGRNASPTFLGSTDVVWFLRGLAPDSLHTERLTEKEVGYLGQFHNIGTTVNARYFDDYYYDLISEQFNIYNFTFTNDGTSHQRGFELDASTILGTRWLLNQGISYTDIDANTTYEYDNYAQLAGFITGSYQVARDWDVGLGYFATQYGNDLASYRRVDLNIGYQPSEFKRNLRFQLTANYYPTNSFDFSIHPNYSSAVTDVSTVSQSYNSKFASSLKVTWNFQ